MHTNFILRQQFARLLKAQQIDEEEDKEEMVALTSYVDASIEHLRHDIKKSFVADQKGEDQSHDALKSYIDGNVKKLREDVNKRLESIKEEDQKDVQRNIDDFVFDCKGYRYLLFELELVHKDLTEIKLLNPALNGVYKISVFASKQTAPNRYISESIKSLSNNIIVRSNFDKLYVQLNRSYILKFYVTQENGKFMALLKVNDFCGNGSYARRRSGGDKFYNV